MLEYKLVEADSYIELGDKYYNKSEYTKALECYDKAFISYLEIYGDEHPESMKLSSKVEEVMTKIS